MPRSSLLVALAAAVLAADPAPKTTPTPAPTPPPAPPPTSASVTPTCIDVEQSVDGIPSRGKLKVPTTIDAETGYRDMDAVREINQKFKVEQVEKLVFDNSLDLPSQARLLAEFRCFGTWKRQHEFYRKVLREHRCAYLRHKAVQLLEYDLCAESTVIVLVQEFRKSIYQQTRELIIRKLGMSRDSRATALVEDQIRAKSQILSKAAKEGKSLGTAQPCMPQEGADKPYYGYMDIGDICEGLSPEDGSGMVVGSQKKQTEPEGDSAQKGATAAGIVGASGEPPPPNDSGGATNVHFGN